MKRNSFFSFLKKNKDEKIAQDVIDILRNNCVSYLSNLRRLMKGNKSLFYSYIMLHGTHSLTSDYTVLKRLYTKQDKVFPKQISKIIDTNLKNLHGIAGRSGCMSVSADFEYVKKYGQIYVIFPLRRFDIL